MKKIAWKIYYILFIALTLWGIFSWFEVITHNSMPTDYAYSNLNMFKLFTLLF